MRISDWSSDVCSSDLAGHLRMGIARRDGLAVAAQLWTVENGVALIHKLAHREDAGAGSPGTLLSHASFRPVIDTDTVPRIDFGTGDDITQNGRVGTKYCCKHCTSRSP